MRLSSNATGDFTSADVAARWVNGFLFSYLLLSVIAIISLLMQMDLLSRAASGGISHADAAATASRQNLIGGLQVFASIATGIAFLSWFHRVHKNLSALGGRDLKYSPGWAVGGFFVPLLCLVRPLQIMREVWHGSDPTALDRDMATSGPSLRNQLGTPLLIGWWWALWLTSGLVERIAMLMGFAQNKTIDGLQAFTALVMVSEVLAVATALLAALLVDHITGWQELRFAAATEKAFDGMPKSNAEVSWAA